MRLVTFAVAAVMLAGCAEADSSGAATEQARLDDTSSGEDGSGHEERPDGDAFHWTPDYEKSSIRFRATQEGAEFEGGFERFEIDIRLNPDDTSDALIEAMIDMSSVDAGDTDRNGALPTSDWFKTKSFPKAAFVSTKIVNQGDGAYVAEGMLTIKGVTKPVSLPFDLKIDGATAEASGGLVLNRTDYNVGEGAFADDKWVGYDVDVNVVVVANR